MFSNIWFLVHYLLDFGSIFEFAISYLCGIYQRDKRSCLLLMRRLIRSWRLDKLANCAGHRRRIVMERLINKQPLSHPYLYYTSHATGMEMNVDIL